VGYGSYAGFADGQSFLGYQQEFRLCRFGGEDAAEPAGGTPAFRL
jgi:hypothetical protein